MIANEYVFTLYGVDFVMFRDFIINLSLLVATLCILGQFYKKDTFHPLSPLKHRIVAGVLFGLQGVLFIFFAMHVSSGVSIDLRQLPILIAALFGGFPAAIVSAAVISAAWIVWEGFAPLSLFSGFTMLVIGVLCGYVSLLRIHKATKYAVMNVIALLMLSIAVSMDETDVALVRSILAAQWILSIAGSVPAFYIAQYISAHNRKIWNLHEKNRRLQESLALTENLSYVDGLTKIPNRRYFDKIAPREWQQAVRSSTSFSMVMLDIDYFKAYNDKYGHQIGDECLIRVAHAIQSAIRRPSDFAARYGGEEFVVLLPDTEADGAAIVAESIRTAIESLNIVHGGSKVSGTVTVSLGIATMKPNALTDSGMLLSLADQALYKAKKEGRNRVAVYSDAS